VQPIQTLARLHISPPKLATVYRIRSTHLVRQSRRRHTALFGERTKTTTRVLVLPALLQKATSSQRPNAADSNSVLGSEETLAYSRIVAAWDAVLIKRHLDDPRQPQLPASRAHRWPTTPKAATRFRPDRDQD